MKNPMLLFSFVALAFVVALSACTKKQSVSVAEMTPAQLAERGKAIYVGNCIACHNSNPTLDGTLGPAVAGSSLELLEARLLRAEYPAGYKPKKETHTMPALPHLKAEIPALAAYLSSLGSESK